MSAATFKVVAVQASPVLLDLDATVLKACALGREERRIIQ